MNSVHIRFSMILLLVLSNVGCMRPKVEVTSNTSESLIDPLEGQLDELLTWFPGEYDNHQQVYQEAEENLDGERRHRQTHHIFQPITMSVLPGRLLYAQQSQHYNLEDIYRQRIYSFTIDRVEQAIKLTIYTPKVPEALTNVHLYPDKLQGLSQDDFILKPGCEVFWKKKGRQFEGYLKTNACNYFSERFGKQVFLNETLILRKDALLLDDKALDEHGALVFGVDDKGPTVNLKEKNCD